MASLNEFINYLETQYNNHSIYVWAAQGEGYPTITEEWIRKMETSGANATRAIAYWKKQCANGFGQVLKAYDCSGLGMAYMCQAFRLPDMTAYGMYNNLCEPISKDQVRKGDWVFKKSSGKISHIGYVVDDALNVIESKGRDYGVTKSSLYSDSKWTVFGRPKMFKAEIEAGIKPSISMTRPLKKGCKGDDVKNLQAELITRGYSCGSSGTDGSFGNATKNAVIAFQKASWPDDPKEWDGVAGRKTLTKLGFTCVW